MQTAAQHAQKQRVLTRQGLERLTQIATLILAAAVLAMAAAIGAIIWQRRPRLAKLKLEGFSRAELWATVVLESLLLLAVGCVSGAILGLLGQQLLDRALATTINYPVVYSVAVPTALAAASLVAVTATAVLTIPGYLAARVPASLALRDRTDRAGCSSPANSHGARWPMTAPLKRLREPYTTQVVSTAP